MKERIIILIVSVLCLMIGYRIGNSFTIFYVGNLFFCFLSFLIFPFLIGFLHKNDSGMSILILTFVVLTLIHNFNHSLEWGVLLLALQILGFLLTKSRLSINPQAIEMFTSFERGASFLKIVSFYNNAYFLKLSIILILIFVGITTYRGYGF